jgi:hypothetical protein
MSYEIYAKKRDPVRDLNFELRVDEIHELVSGYQNGSPRLLALHPSAHAHEEEAGSGDCDGKAESQSASNFVGGAVDEGAGSTGLLEVLSRIEHVTLLFGRFITAREIYAKRELIDLFLIKQFVKTFCQIYRLPCIMD